MPTWSPEQYLKFGDERLQPALDLMGRVPLEDPGIVVDLGCGLGNVTRRLAGRWPAARIVGVDTSPEMLAKARAGGDDGIEWLQADIRDWQPDDAPDVLYSNAALQWIDHHETLFAHLLGLLAPGGVLAVQMPRNREAPAQVLVDEVSRDPRWAAKVAGLLRPGWVSTPDAYYGWLAPHAAHVEVWETVYWHVLRGEDPVVEFTKGTMLRPILEALDAADRDAFMADYTARVRVAYPPRTDGTTLYPFRRLFVVAVAPDPTE